MLTRLKLEVRALARRSPIKAVALAGIAILWLVDTWMCAIAGYRKAGGDMQAMAFGYAMVMIALALIATWTPWEAKHQKGWKSFGLWVLALPLFFLVQNNGWSVMGVTIADGGIKRETRATSRSTAAEDLEMARAERRRLGAVRPVGTIEAYLDLELRRTSKSYPKGDGPKATELRGELASAKRAADLDAAIPKMVSTLNDAPQIAGGGVDRIVLMGLTDGVRSWWHGRPLKDAERVTVEQVEAGWAIFLVFLIGFWAVFGPALILGVSPDSASRSRPGDTEGAPEKFDPAQLPAPPRRRALSGPADMPSASRPAGPGPVDAGPPGEPGHPSVPGAGVGGGATNIINVGSSAPLPQLLPPRISARRAGRM